MEGMFPLGTGISRVRAIISIVKERGGHAGMSDLAEESEEDIDDLLPLIEACKLLGLVTVNKSELKLTRKGNALAFSNFSKTIREGLASTEPFKSVLLIVGDGKVSTADLLSTLRSKGISLHEDEIVNSQQMKKLLLRWGVRSKLLAYDIENDSWCAKRNSK
jgi:NitT/TauT family transport system ATP-binding protein